MLPNMNIPNPKKGREYRWAVSVPGHPQDVAYYREKGFRPVTMEEVKRIGAYGPFVNGMTLVGKNT